MPVYRGAPNVKAFAPADRSLVDAADFAGPAELAAYLNWLDEHDEAYQRYLAWKRTGLSASFGRSSHRYEFTRFVGSARSCVVRLLLSGATSQRLTDA